MDQFIKNATAHDEREFLHDLASPLGTALLLTDSVLDDVQTRADSNPDDITRLSQLYKSLEKVRQLLQQRRDTLIAQGVASART